MHRKSTPRLSETIWEAALRSVWAGGRLEIWAPMLQSPGSGTALRNRTIGTFTSNANANACYYELQMTTFSNFSSITEPDVLLDTPLWRQSAFNSHGIHYWWVRFVDGSGNGGPWSSIRTI